MMLFDSKLRWPLAASEQREGRTAGERKFSVFNEVQDASVSDTSRGNTIFSSV